MNLQNMEELKSEVINDSLKADLKEIDRLKFVLDKSNRFPNLLSNEEMLKMARKLADLERRVHTIMH